MTIKMFWSLLKLEEQLDSQFSCNVFGLLDDITRNLMIKLSL